MNHVWWKRTAVRLVAAISCLAPALCWADAPAQKLPSAMLVYPLIQVDGGGGDTRIEMVNLSGDPQVVECFYIDGSSCNEIGFVVSLTAYQPVAWFAGGGFSNSGSAIPPFSGTTGALDCVVVPPQPGVEFHNTIQGRATVFDTTGRTISYGAVGFQRLTDGDFTGTVSLDGNTYAQCPAILHFDVLADPTSSSGTLCDASDPRSCMILLTCSQNLLLQVSSRTNVQFLVTNEFEQSFSSSTTVTCFAEGALSDFTDSLSQARLGSATAHLSVRGVGVPLLGLVRDSVPFASSFGTAGNEPSFQGGRSAVMTFPDVVTGP
ncbi:MAG TPA: hypothetical protein VN812_18355 [Candidatus Acidoferrales bacterium]|nr:hypothetical protein [Candidatus Acidoferrales bacterium]